MFSCSEQPNKEKEDSATRVQKGASHAEQHISKRDRGMELPERARQNEKEKKYAFCGSPLPVSFSKPGPSYIFAMGDPKSESQPRRAGPPHNPGLRKLIEGKRKWHRPERTLLLPPEGGVPSAPGTPPSGGSGSPFLGWHE